jgi:hypothetical protein
MADLVTTPSAPANGGYSKNQDGKTFRLFSATKIAKLKRAMDGAERRMLRLETELVECRAIIRRKYTDVLDEKDEVVGRNLLSSEQVFGFKLKRTQIEKDLALAKRDFFTGRKTYRSAVTNNFQVERKTVKLIREENKIMRESKKFTRLTIEILKKRGSNGGSKEFKTLTDLAVAGDVKAFRNGFEVTMEQFDSSHHTLISGVCSVKTEIIHGVMEELANMAAGGEFGLDVVTK